MSHQIRPYRPHAQMRIFRNPEAPLMRNSLKWCQMSSVTTGKLFGQNIAVFSMEHTNLAKGFRSTDLCIDLYRDCQANRKKIYRYTDTHLTQDANHASFITFASFVANMTL